MAPPSRATAQDVAEETARPAPATSRKTGHKKTLTDQERILPRIIKFLKQAGFLVTVWIGTWSYLASATSSVSPSGFTIELFQWVILASLCRGLSWGFSSTQPVSNTRRSKMPKCSLLWRQSPRRKTPFWPEPMNCQVG